MIYTDNEHLKTELQIALKRSGKKQVEIAHALQIVPQQLVNMMNKKQFSFYDVSRIAEAAGLRLVYDFQPAPVNEDPADVPSDQ